MEVSDVQAAAWVVAGTGTDSMTKSISADVCPASTWKLARLISKAIPQVKSPI